MCAHRWVLTWLVCRCVLHLRLMGITEVLTLVMRACTLYVHLLYHI